MVILHQSWKKLRNKLAVSDPASGKRGTNQRLVIEIEPITYDPEIPIIGDGELEIWFQYHSARKLKPALPKTPSPLTTTKVATIPKKKPTPPSKHPKPIKPITINISPLPPKPKQPDELPKQTAQITRPLIKVRPKVRTRRPTPTEHSSSEDTPTKAESSNLKKKCVPVLDSSEDESQVKPPSKSKVAKSVWSCETDQLVLSEVIDDEYAAYADEDDEEIETELSKNLKKIRSEPPTPKRLVPEIQNSVLNQKNLTPVKTPPRQPPEPVKQIEPDWVRTAVSLKNKEFSNVFKDLHYFSKHLSNNNEARSLLKELVIKCIHEDETSLLDDIFMLIYQNNFSDDVEFWSEIVLRLKRKLGNHGGVLSFKSKSKSEWVYENYKRAILSVSRYSRDVNLTLRLPFFSMIFLIDPLGRIDQLLNPIEVSKPSVSNEALPEVDIPAPETTLIIDTPHDKFISTGLEPSPPKSKENPPGCIGNSSNSKVEDQEPNPECVLIKTEPIKLAKAELLSPGKITQSGPSEIIHLKKEVILNKFKVFFPDIKPVIKREKPVDVIDKQENVDPKTKRKVTMTKDASGTIRFAISRPRVKK